MSAEARLIEQIAALRYDPLKYARFAFSWGVGDLAGSDGPRKWQAEILGEIRDHLSSPATRHTPFQCARSSGHGIGKSALIGIIVQWAISTCVDCKVVLTANTKDQLITKTSPEVAKWFRLAINSHWWDVNTLSIKSRDKQHDDTWRADFLTWSLNNLEAFAGLHNLRKRIVVIYDEASGIDDKVSETTEGALTDADTEILWFKFGNPTQPSGDFFECIQGKKKHRWKSKQIDSRTVEGTNLAQFQTWIDDYGEDSDFVRVRVRGEFPRAGSNQFIASDVIAAARKFKAEAYEKLPKILSVDVARFGDDQTVIGWRQGRKAVILAKYRGIDTVQTAERVIEFIGKEKPDGVVVDGDGLGAGVVDHLNHRGFKTFEFHGGATPMDINKYFNRRAEIWGEMREWLGAGCEIPDDPELAGDLSGPQYGFSAKQQIQLERKEDMKKRGLASPDCGDMLAMTFAVKMAARKTDVLQPVNHYGEAGWMA
jgi:hypothetical protein